MPTHLIVLSTGLIVVGRLGALLSPLRGSRRPDVKEPTTAARLFGTGASWQVNAHPTP